MKEFRKIEIEEKNGHCIVTGEHTEETARKNWSRQVLARYDMTPDAVPERWMLPDAREIYENIGHEKISLSDAAKIRKALVAAFRNR